MRILLTNDDGVNAAGFGALQQVAAAISDDVWCVAPETDQSGTAHSLSLHEPLRCKQLSDKIYSVRGTPTDCVLMGVLNLMPKKPDLILSGINHGENAGADVTYSGTIAGAIEGTQLGVPSIAISLSLGGRTAASGHWNSPIQHAPALIKRLVAARWPANVLVNINFPDCPPDDVKPAMATRQSVHEEGLWKIVDRMDGRGQPYFWVGYEGRNKNAPGGTDLWAIQRNHISVTPLHLDLTHDATVDKLAKALGT